MIVYMYLLDFFGLKNPSATTVYARSPFYTQSAFYPWSAVRSLRFTLTDFQSREPF